MAIDSIEGGRMPFIVDGDGPPLIMVHGVGLDHHMFDLVVGPLAHSRRVVRFDLWGHGVTENPPGPRTLDDFVDQLIAVIDGLNLERPSVAGFSLGGLVTRAAAARHPDLFDRVAILNCVYGRAPDQRADAIGRLELAEAEGMEPIAELALKRWFTGKFRATYPERIDIIRNRLETTDLDGYLKAYRVFVDGDLLMSESVGEIAAPTLVLTGALDAGSTAAMAEAMAADIPDARLCVMQGVHHLSPVEDPVAFIDHIEAFLDEGTS